MRAGRRLISESNIKDRLKYLHLFADFMTQSIDTLIDGGRLFEQDVLQTALQTLRSSHSVIDRAPDNLLQSTLFTFIKAYANRSGAPQSITMKSMEGTLNGMRTKFNKLKTPDEIGQRVRVNMANVFYGLMGLIEQYALLPEYLMSMESRALPGQDVPTFDAYNQSRNIHRYTLGSKVGPNFQRPGLDGGVVQSRNPSPKPL